MERSFQPGPDRPGVEILLASNNAHKLHELRQIFAGGDVRFVSPADVSLSLDVDETGATFEENAALKALAFAKAAGMPSLADDSGLEIDALGGEPGVRSHRFAGPHATDPDRIVLVLRKLEGVPDARRTARFRCVMALATPAGLVGTVQGVCEGRIAHAPEGENGFGYDPIFFVPEKGKTMAQLGSEEKHAISHRGRAGVAARDLIRRWLAEQPAEPRG